MSSFIRAPRGNVRGSVRREPTRASSSQRDVAVEHFLAQLRNVAPNIVLEYSTPTQRIRVHLVSSNEALYAVQVSRGIGTGSLPRSDTPRDTLYLYSLPLSLFPL